MKKGIKSLTVLFFASVLVFASSCNGAQSHDDTDRTQSENGSSHPTTTDTVMTDTTKTAHGSQGNNMQMMDTASPMK